jgi:hypothetical protein
MIGSAYLAESTPPCNEVHPTSEDMLSLYESQNVDALTLGAVLSNNELWKYCPTWEGNADSIPEPISFLERALRIDADDTLALQTAANICAKTTPATKDATRAQFCELDIGKLLTINEPDNGWYWLYYSTAKYRNQDKVSALRLLEKAAESKYMNLRFAEQSIAFSSAVKNYYQAPVESVSVYAIEHAAANLPPFGPLVEMCRDEAAENAEWSTACMGAGHAMEVRSNSLIMVRIGLGLQRRLYKQNGDDDGIAALEVRDHQLDQLMQQYGKLVAGDKELVEEFGQQWLADFLNHGELGAMQLAIERASP